MTTETVIQKQILDFLRLSGIFCWRNNNIPSQIRPGVYRANNTLKGVSDIIGVLPDGKFLGIEVKTGSGKVSKHQKKFIDDIVINKGVCFVARSVEETREYLQDYL